MSLLLFWWSQTKTWTDRTRQSEYLSPPERLSPWRPGPRSDPVVLNISQMLLHCWTVENHWTKEDEQSPPSCAALMWSSSFYTLNLLSRRNEAPTGPPGGDTPELCSRRLDSPAPPVCSPVQPPDWVSFKEFQQVHNDHMITDHWPLCCSVMTSSHRSKVTTMKTSRS